MAACAPWRRYPANALGLVLGAYGAWLLGNAVLVTPVHSAESLYQPLMLLAGFAAAARLERSALPRLLMGGVAVSVALVLAGFLQYFGGIGFLNDVPNRASGTFMTPNTLGTAINLFLAPMAALYLLRGGRGVLACSVLLFAGLVATESRGAMLALAAGLAFLALLLGRDGLRRAGRRLAALGAGCLLAALAVTWTAQWLAPVLRASGAAAPGAESWVGRGTWDRSEMYAATLGLILERPLAGSGANTFFPRFETVKPEVLRGADYYYAHSDYLQVWLEFGVPGLLLLLLVVALSLGAALRAARSAPQDPLPVLCGAALATCFAHAMVDFPLYVPFVLAVTGAYLGVLAAAEGSGRVPAALQRVGAALRAQPSPLVRGALVAAALAWLAQPVVAELASLRGVALLAKGETRDALYWQAVARRFEPRHPAHYWAEAMTWRELLAEQKNPLFAAEADALFVRGMRASPYDVANLLGRAALHQQYGSFLAGAASAEQVVAWTRRAAELRPQHAIAQAEHARALALAGRTEEARALARSLATRFPQSEAVRRLSRAL